jgi:hypothetical protein
MFRMTKKPNRKAASRPIEKAKYIKRILTQYKKQVVFPLLLIDDPLTDNIREKILKFFERKEYRHLRHKQYRKKKKKAYIDKERAIKKEYPKIIKKKMWYLGSSPMSRFMTSSIVRPKDQKFLIFKNKYLKKEIREKKRYFYRTKKKQTQVQDKIDTTKILKHGDTFGKLGYHYMDYLDNFPMLKINTLNEKIKNNSRNIDFEIFNDEYNFIRNYNNTIPQLTREEISKFQFLPIGRLSKRGKRTIRNFFYRVKYIVSGARRLDKKRKRIWMKVKRMSKNKGYVKPIWFYDLREAADLTPRDIITKIAKLKKKKKKGKKRRNKIKNISHLKEREKPSILNRIRKMTMNFWNSTVSFRKKGKKRRKKKATFIRERKQKSHQKAKFIAALIFPRRKLMIRKERRYRKRLFLQNLTASRLLSGYRRIIAYPVGLKKLIFRPRRQKKTSKKIYYRYMNRKRFRNKGTQLKYFTIPELNIVATGVDENRYYYEFMIKKNPIDKRIVTRAILLFNALLKSRRFAKKQLRYLKIPKYLTVKNKRIILAKIRIKKNYVMPKFIKRLWIRHVLKNRAIMENSMAYENIFRPITIRKKKRQKTAAKRMKSTRDVAAKDIYGFEDEDDFEDEFEQESRRIRRKGEIGYLRYATYFQFRNSALQIARHKIPPVMHRKYQPAKRDRREQNLFKYIGSRGMLNDLSKKLLHRRAKNTYYRRTGKKNFYSRPFFTIRKNLPRVTLSILNSNTLDMQNRIDNLINKKTNMINKIKVFQPWR